MQKRRKTPRGTSVNGQEAAKIEAKFGQKSAQQWLPNHNKTGNQGATILVTKAQQRLLPKQQK
jgi:hypothetical protein